MDKMLIKNTKRMDEKKRSGNKKESLKKYIHKICMISHISTHDVHIRGIL